MLKSTFDHGGVTRSSKRTAGVNGTAPWNKSNNSYLTPKSGLNSSIGSNICFCQVQLSLHGEVFTAVGCEGWDYHSQANQPLLQTKPITQGMNGWNRMQLAGKHLQSKVRIHLSHSAARVDTWLFRWRTDCLNVRGPRLAATSIIDWVAEVGQTFGSLQKNIYFFYC